jgi:hypothetical protein
LSFKKKQLSTLDKRVVCDSAAGIRETTHGSPQSHGRRLNLRPSFSAVVALALLCGAVGAVYNARTATAGEITGLIAAHDRAIQRITLGNGSIFSVPSWLPAGALDVGSVVRVTFTEYGEDDDEVQVTNIVQVCKDMTGPYCRQFRIAE